MILRAGKFTSMPVRSISSNGPMRKPQVSRITASTWLGLALPSCMMRSPSVPIAVPPRLTRKPGVSPTTTGTRVWRLPSATMASTTHCAVSAARITSTSFISGTGLK